MRIEPELTRYRCASGKTVSHRKTGEFKLIQREIINRLYGSLPKRYRSRPSQLGNKNLMKNAVAIAFFDILRWFTTLQPNGSLHNFSSRYLKLIKIGIVSSLEQKV